MIAVTSFSGGGVTEDEPRRAWDRGLSFFPRFQASQDLETGSYIYHGRLLLHRLRRNARTTHDAITNPNF